MSSGLNWMISNILVLLLAGIFSAAHGLSNDCPSSMCGDLEVKFPFTLDTSPEICRKAGRNATLSCSSSNLTILTLPSSESYRVTALSYEYVDITIQFSPLPSNCPWPTNFSPPNTTGSIFKYYNSYTVLLKCTSKLNLKADHNMVAGPISCISGAGSYFYAVDYEYGMDELPPYCIKNSTIKYPIYSQYIFSPIQNYTHKATIEETVALQVMGIDMYDDPCHSCVIIQEKNCGYNQERNLKFCVSHRSSHVLIKGIISGSVVIVFLTAAVLVLVLFLKKYIREKEMRFKVEQFLASYKSTKLTRYSFAEIKKITNRFKHKLGQGGFGSVYKGELKNGVPVAIKMPETSRSNREDFINEVATIGKIHHFNVVRLLGFCSDGTNQALVYEFMPNESLEKFIFSDDSKKNHQLFSMEKLEKIVVGIAQGINYLHQECNQRIIHFDIKPHNILLDYDFNPKIADFGLAKLCSRDQSVVTISAARGTLGYIAPEVYSRNFGQVSHKSDVYSFGMLLLEMIGRRKNVDPTFENPSEIYFPEWIYNKMIYGHDLGTVMEIENAGELIKKLAIIALWCIQWNPAERPSMSKVVQMLMRNLDNLEIPPRPFIPSLQQEDNDPTGQEENLESINEC